MRWDRILIITMIKVSKYGRWISDNGRIMSSRSRIFLVSGSDTRNRPPRPQKHCWILRKIQTCPHYLMNIWNTRVDEQVRGGADSVTCSAAPCVTLFIGKSTTKSFISCLGSWGEKKRTFFLLRQEGRKALSSRYFGGGVLRCTGWAQPLARRFSSVGDQGSDSVIFRSDRRNAPAGGPASQLDSSR